MKKHFLLILLLTGVTSLSQLHAEYTLTDDDGEKKLLIGGSGYMMFGQVVSGHAYAKQNQNLLEKHWQNYYSGRIDVSSVPVEWFKTKLSFEVSSNWPLLRESSIMKDVINKSFKANLPQAVGIFDFDFDFMTFMIETGLMEYAFNTQVKNLGNYLYRSQAYPLYLTTNLDYIYSNILGIRFETGFFDNSLKIGAMLSSITTKPPLFDMNLGLFASYTTPNKFLDAGIGVCFDRFKAMDSDITDAKDLRAQLTDSTVTFRSTKIDLRITLDPKALLFPDSDIFGPNDLKIYGEGAILGTTDPDYYPIDPDYPSEEDDLFARPSLINRMPIMFGLNVPTFKGLDYLTFEIEFCKYPYAFDWWGEFAANPSPQPTKTTDERWTNIYKNRDNIKWTLYAKKSISDFDIIAIFANDHINYPTYNGEGQFNSEQSFRKNWDWHWYIKLQYNL
jgi:hypothetical protein